MTPPRRTQSQDQRKKRKNTRWFPGHLNFARPKKPVTEPPTNRKIKPAITDAEIRRIRLEIAEEGPRQMA